MHEHEVAIIGSGPTGLMLAAELALAGVDVAVVERRENQEIESARGGGLHARTIEILDQRGVAERFISQGQKAQTASFARNVLDISDFPVRHNYGLALWQQHTERTLDEWVRELDVRHYRGRSMTGFTQDATGVDVTLSHGETMRARYLVGCDGGRSLVRKLAGIDFVGWDASVSYLIAEVAMTEPPPAGVRRGEHGINALGPLDARYRVVLSDHPDRHGDELTLDDVRRALVAVYGRDFGVHDPTWISKFTDMARQATHYRADRVLLAGDAAHVHSPVGGQGLNTGMQDAVNLGWKLAQVVQGVSPESLLDSYHTERHPVAARVLRYTMAHSALDRGDDQAIAANEFVADLMRMNEPRKRYAAMASGLDIHYDLGSGHPLLGRRMPDLDLGTTRVFALLHEARPVLLDLSGGIDIPLWTDRVRLVKARYDGKWDLPVLGEVSAPAAVLIRPDGHVAWVGEGATQGLEDALTRWFGAPTGSQAESSSR